MADSAFAPVVDARCSSGPMQPVQGMFPPGHAAAQPARVAGPRQTRPCASRQRSGSMSICVRPLERLHQQLVRLRGGARALRAQRHVGREHRTLLRQRPLDERRHRRRRSGPAGGGQPGR